MLVAGVLLGCAAAAILWVNPPAGDEDSSIMPLGPRHITVYNRVIVGSDGTPSSLYAVDRAHAVAAEAEAQVVVVSAYSPTGEAMEGDRKLVADASAAQEALRATVQHLTSDRVRRIEQRVVAGDPAQALLDVAGNDPANLIVVGNRGLGARDGDNLGSVPAEVVRNAVCDVLIVQGTQESPKSVTVPF
jgi:maltose/moltooligosaccharide transporter